MENTRKSRAIILFLFGPDFIFGCASCEQILTHMFVYFLTHVFSNPYNHVFFFSFTFSDKH